MIHIKDVKRATCYWIIDELIQKAIQEHKLNAFKESLAKVKI